MTIKDLSDEALSRWIAEKIEPNPVCLFTPVEAFPKGGTMGGRYLSKEKCWFIQYGENEPHGHNEPRDMVNDAQMTLMLMTEMKKRDMRFTIYSEPDYREATDIDAHKDAINEFRDYGISLQWGDSNCPYHKPYDPEDGHGFTDLELIADSIGRAVAEAYALAHGWKGEEDHESGLLQRP